MCVVSAIMDEGMRRWPPAQQPQQPFFFYNPAPAAGGAAGVDLPTRAEFNVLKQAIEAGKRADEILQQKDCELTEKLAWFEQLEQRVVALETQQSLQHQPEWERRSSLDEEGGLIVNSNGFFRAIGEGTTQQPLDAHIFTRREFDVMSLSEGTDITFVPVDALFASDVCGPSGAATFTALAIDLRKAAQLLNRVSEILPDAADSLGALSLWAQYFEDGNR